MYSRPRSRGTPAWLALGLIILTAALAGPASAIAENAVITWLRSNPVYVDTAAPGTDSDTQGVLTTQLHDGDHILIAMLPEGNVPPGEYAFRINRSLGGEKIVGVTVGEKAAAYSTILPSGVAADLMKRAATVSTTTDETLGTFIQNVHDWQKLHPHAPAATPESTGDHSGLYWILLAGVVVFVVLGGLVFFLSVKHDSGAEAVRFKKSPETVRDQLNELLKFRSRVEDPSLASTLTQICRDTEAYFARAGKSSNTDAFRQHLESLNNVIEKYVDVQDNPRYFADAPSLLRSGKEAAESFAEFVLTTIQRGSRRDLTDFRVDTDILSAQRYR